MVSKGIYEVVSQKLRQDEGVVVNSGFKKVLKVSKLSAINGQKESHRPREAHKGQATGITTQKCP